MRIRLEVQLPRRSSFWINQTLKNGIVYLFGMSIMLNEDAENFYFMNFVGKHMDYFLHDIASHQSVVILNTNNNVYLGKITKWEKTNPNNIITILEAFIKNPTLIPSCSIFDILVYDAEKYNPYGKQHISKFRALLQDIAALSPESAYHFVSITTSASMTVYNKAYSNALLLAYIKNSPSILFKTPKPCNDIVRVSTIKRCFNLMTKKQLDIFFPYKNRFLHVIDDLYKARYAEAINEN